MTFQVHQVASNQEYLSRLFTKKQDSNMGLPLRLLENQNVKINYQFDKLKKKSRLHIWPRLKEFIRMMDDLFYHLCKTQTSNKYE